MKIERSQAFAISRWCVVGLTTGWVALTIGWSGAATAVAEDAPAGHSTADAERLFAIKVAPLLQDKCLACHGAEPDDLKGDFSVLSLDAMVQGGESGEAGLQPGDADAGTVIEAIRWDGLEMPPKSNDRLTAEQVRVVEAWVRSGAPWPDAETQQRYRDEEAERWETEDGVMVATSGGTSEAWTRRRYDPDDLWAFQKVQPRETVLPRDVADAAAIDFFVDRGIRQSGLTPAPRADDRTLIRRLTFDLTGLPPTPEAIATFVSDSQTDREGAYGRLVDRLLASPRYGERWARHWLDVTRYADTGGMSNDYERSNMWRYRDYVIRAFNDDKPYDEFVIEQLAGDELADDSIRRRYPDDPDAVRRAQDQGDYNPQESEWIVATGFLRLGPWDNAMVMKDEARQMYLDDVVNITGQTFLGQTMRCCKCHDHKFDPLPTRDYYRMYAAFATTMMAERNVPLLDCENTEGFTDGEAHLRRMLKFATTRRDVLVNKREAAAKAWFKAHDLPYVNEAKRKDLPDDEKPPRHVGLDYTEQGELKVREQDVWIWQRRLERYQPMAQSVYNDASFELAWNGARKLRIRRSKGQTDPPQSFILGGGALGAPGDPVGPGVPSFLGIGIDEPVGDDPYRIDDAVEGRRTALARWIVRPDNALTTRAIVNRIWQSHFGRGIAGNPNNLGAKGARPTHPELLDYLAGELVQGGWTLKRLHRMIVMTEAYRRSSGWADEASKSNDPDNRWLSRFPRRRLSAEEIRDAMLAVSGELVHCDGGVPIKPEINMEVALQPRMIQFSLAPAYQPSPTPQLRNRRTIYAYQVRGQPDPFLSLFGQPGPNESCELRDSAAVTPQVFTMVNSDVIADRSIALARRIIRERQTRPTQIGRAFELVLGRSPLTTEIERMTHYVDAMDEYHRNHPPEPVRYPTEITRSLVEEFTGQPFEYREILPVFEHYQPDAKGVDVDAQTRALADLCMLLLNTNEFMYVE